MSVAYVCDGCGAVGPTARHTNDAETYAEDAGWLLHLGDLCPRCRGDVDGGEAVA